MPEGSTVQVGDTDDSGTPALGATACSDVPDRLNAMLGGDGGG